MNKAMYDYYSTKIPSKFEFLKNTIKFKLEEGTDSNLIATQDQIEIDMFNMGIDWDGSTPLPKRVEDGIWGNMDKEVYTKSSEYRSIVEKFQMFYTLIKDSITSANIEVSLFEEKYEEEYSYL